jgi:hypothetical protein
MSMEPTNVAAPMHMSFRTCIRFLLTVEGRDPSEEMIQRACACTAYSVSKAGLRVE